MEGLHGLLFFSLLFLQTEQMLGVPPCLLIGGMFCCWDLEEIIIVRVYFYSKDILMASKGLSV
jgi:hypothetical protein